MLPSSLSSFSSGVPFTEYVVTKNDSRMRKNNSGTLYFADDEGENYLLKVLSSPPKQSDPHFKDGRINKHLLDSQQWPDMINWYGDKGFTSVVCWKDPVNKNIAILGPRRLNLPLPSPAPSCSQYPADKGKGKAVIRSTSGFPPNLRSRSTGSSTSSGPWDMEQGPLGYAVGAENLEAVSWGGVKQPTSIRLGSWQPDSPKQYELLLAMQNGRLLNPMHLLRCQQTTREDQVQTGLRAAFAYFFGREEYSICTLHTRPPRQPLAVILGPKRWDEHAAASKPTESLTKHPTYKEITTLTGGEDRPPASGASLERIGAWMMKNRRALTDVGHYSEMHHESRTPSPSGSSYRVILSRNKQTPTGSGASSQGSGMPAGRDTRMSVRTTSRNLGTSSAERGRVGNVARPPSSTEHVPTRGRQPGNQGGAQPMPRRSLSRSASMGDNPQKRN